MDEAGGNYFFNKKKRLKNVNKNKKSSEKVGLHRLLQLVQISVCLLEADFLGSG